MISLLSSARVIIGIGILLTPLLSFAAGDFVPLVGIPFVDTTEVSSLPAYANALYIAAISLGAVIAVLKIIWAGIKYMLSDVITDKSKAKQDIRGALIGLIIMISAVLILNTINPQITQLTALDLQDLTVEGGGGTAVDTCNITTGCTTILECKVGEKLIQSIDDTGNIIQSCIPDDNPYEPPVPGTVSVPITYICDRAVHPDGCMIPSDYDTYRSVAEAECNRLSGGENQYDLIDDPARLGYGICTYVPPTN